MSRKNLVKKMHIIVCGRMKAEIICFLIFFSSSLYEFVEALSPTNITCTGSTLHDFRIKGCSDQPCTIRKGEPLPFEVDLSFAEPSDTADRVYFNVYMPKYAVPPAVHGTKLITATCEEDNLGFECPITSNEKYTVKSTLFIDSAAQCTANCTNLGFRGTGLRETKWRWTISDTGAKKNRKHGKNSISPKRAYSVCTFKVTLNIVA